MPTPALPTLILTHLPRLQRPQPGPRAAAAAAGARRGWAPPPPWRFGSEPLLDGAAAAPPPASVYGAWSWQESSQGEAGRRAATAGWMVVSKPPLGAARAEVVGVCHAPYIPTRGTCRPFGVGGGRGGQWRHMRESRADEGHASVSLAVRRPQVARPSCVQAVCRQHVPQDSP